MLHSSEVERLRRELRELRATCAAGRRRLNSTEEKLLESSLNSAEGLSGQLAAQRHEAAQLRQVLTLTPTPDPESLTPNPDPDPDPDPMVIQAGTLRSGCS